MANVEIEGLRTFLAVARLGGFGRAAQALNRSQPAISRRIELLEREIGLPLFERVRGGAALTDAGITLLPYANSLLATDNDALQALRALSSGEEGRVSLALVGTLANSVLTRALRSFTQRHPKVRLDLRTATSQEVGDLVQNGAATLGLRYLVDQRTELVATVIAKEKMILVGGAEHRLADGCRHQARELRGERWVAFPGSRESLVQVLRRRLLAAGIEESEIIPIDSLSAQKRLVEAGFGIALLALSAVEDELRSRTLRVIDVPALQVAVPVTVVHRRKGYLSPVARNLLAMISETLLEYSHE